MPVSQRGVIIVFLLVIITSIHWNKDYQIFSLFKFVDARSLVVPNQKQRFIEVHQKLDKDNRVLECEARSFEIIYMSNGATSISRQRIIGTIFLIYTWHLLHTLFYFTLVF